MLFDKNVGKIIDVRYVKRTALMQMLTQMIISVSRARAGVCCWPAWAQGRDAKCLRAPNQPIAATVIKVAGRKTVPSQMQHRNGTADRRLLLPATAALPGSPVPFARRHANAMMWILDCRAGAIRPGRGGRRTAS
jgi:hypothetical protein